MNAITETQPRSVLFDMAARYGMEPDAFELTVRETCSPKGRDSRPLSKAEFAAFLLVSKEYGLNPLTKEIYAFPAKGGGIVPILSIDGWISLVNSHKQCNGFEFEFHDDSDGNLISCTCKMYRKDRERPIIVTEYFEECKRDTEPWRMKHRMLRHKALIQAARYAFGFSGIYDEDEGETIAMRDVTPASEKRPPAPPPAPPKPEDEIIDVDPEDERSADDAVEEATVEDEQPTAAGAAEQTATGADAPFDPDEYLNWVDDEMAAAKDEKTVEAKWGELEVDARLKNDHPDHYAMALGMKRDAEKRVKK